MQKIIFSLLVIMLFGYLAVSPAIACSCARQPSPYIEFNKYAVVFVGLVKDVTDDKKIYKDENGREVMDLSYNRTFHFVIEESLKGIKQDQVEIAVNTGAGGGDCGYQFQIGERYLVYAAAPENSNKIYTGICTRTRLLKDSQIDLDLIRLLIKGHSDNRLFGVISEQLAEPGQIHYDRSEPKGGITLILTNDKKQYQTVTDTEGRYAFKNLTPGKYRLQVTVPENYSLTTNTKDVDFEFEVKTEAWSLEKPFSIRFDGRISGRVYDANGLPVDQEVEVSIVSTATIDRDPRLQQRLYQTTKTDGSYEFTNLPAGSYIIGTNLSVNMDKYSPFSKTYYPSANNPAAAAIIILTSGQKLSDCDIHLLPREDEFVINGSVIQDGKVVTDATVMLYEVDDYKHPIWSIMVGTDNKGNFSIKCLKGHRYKLAAQLGPKLSAIYLGSDIMEIDTNQEVLPMTLVIKKQRDPNW